MKRILLFTLLLFIVETPLFLSGVEFCSEARWIWAEGDKKPDPARRKFKRSDARYELWAPQKAYLRYVIHVKEPVKRAFYYAFWDKTGSFYLNGRKLAPMPWKNLPPTFGHVKGKGNDLTRLLKRGKNVLAAFEVTLPGKYTSAADIFTGTTYTPVNGKLQLRSERPRVWFFELKK